MTAVYLSRKTQRYYGFIFIIIMRFTKYLFKISKLHTRANARDHHMHVKRETSPTTKRKYKTVSGVPYLTIFIQPLITSIPQLVESALHVILASVTNHLHRTSTVIIGFYRCPAVSGKRMKEGKGRGVGDHELRRSTVRRSRENDEWTRVALPSLGPLCGDQLDARGKMSRSWPHTWRYLRSGTTENFLTCLTAAGLINQRCGPQPRGARRRRLGRVRKFLAGPLPERGCCMAFMANCVATWYWQNGPLPFLLLSFFFFFFSFLIYFIFEKYLDS